MFPVRKTWRKLHLVSPPMHDGPNHHKEIHEAQELLTKNRFENFKPGHIDGSYGLHSWHATRRSKFWLGYKRREVNGRFGEQLRAHLLPPEHPQHKKLTRVMKVRRTIRIKRHAISARRRNSIRNVMLRSLEYQRHQLGYHEYPPNSNDNKAGAWYGANGVAWCAIWQCYSAIIGAGYQGRASFLRGSRWSFVPFIVADAVSHRNGLEVVSSMYADRQCLVCYDWNHDGTADHVEQFDEWIVKGATFYAIGGNTGPASLSNGGEVARSVRYVSEVQHFCKVVA